MYIVQRVLNCLNYINSNSIKTYVLCLMLATGRKNCAAMAHSIGIPEKRLYAFMFDAKSHSTELEAQLLALADKTRTEGVLRALIIDPTAIIKHYAQKMEKICYDRAGCTKKVEKGLVPVYAAIADVNTKIPLNLEFWVQAKIIGKRQYKSKVKIAQNLILDLIQKKLRFDFVSLDGAFSQGEQMFTFFKQEALNFIMRIAKNRRVITEDGVFAQLKNHPALKLKRNEREKTVKAKLYNETYFFTIQKRKTRSGEWEEVFLVSNMDLSAKEQIAAYDLRWPVEKMIRTTKQKFGAAQCQMVSVEKQRAHILAGFLAYTILDIVNNDKQTQSVDEMVNVLRNSYFDDLLGSASKEEESENRQNIDPIVDYFQNPFQNSPNKFDSINT